MGMGGPGPRGELAAIRDDDELERTWAAAAEEVRADILEHGVSDRGVLRQHYDTDALDASTLLAAIFGFLPGTDERMRATVDALADELTEHGFVLRYRTGETDDGLSGKEGTFLICSFWLVSAFAIVGEMQRATDLMERLLRIASPLGLYAEEFEVDRARHLGNFPQAFSHLALIEAAGRIILTERRDELLRLSAAPVPGRTGRWLSLKVRREPGSALPGRAIVTVESGSLPSTPSAAAASAQGNHIGGLMTIATRISAAASLRRWPSSPAQPPHPPGRSTRRSTTRRTGTGRRLPLLQGRVRRTA